MTQTISKIHGREVLDSRGNPTLEVELFLSNGSFGRAIVPSGASKGQHEALELRDGDKKRYLGKGTLKAVSHVNDKIASALKGRPLTDLRSLDKMMIELDGTPQKSNLGANALLGVSLAAAHALAASQKRPLFLLINETLGLGEKEMNLPVPLMNIINGGEHANNTLEIQEFMVVPHGFDSFSNALRAGVEVFHHLKRKLSEKDLTTAVGDEGGFAPSLATNENALVIICESIRDAGYELGREVSVALDVAASSFYCSEKQKYEFALEGQDYVNRETLVNYYGQLLEKFPLVSIEDGLDENDWAGWKTLTEKYGKRVQLVGDDLFVTQTAWVERGIREHVANAVLIKVNQVGTLTETFETMTLCRKNGYRTVVSHRSGETEDVTISHLAVGSGAGQIKTGSASRSERIAKYNELLRIEEWAKEQGKPLAFRDPFSK